MKRTTIVLPDDLRTRAMKRAHKTKVSLAELIRRSLEETLRRKVTDSWDDDPFFSDMAVFRMKGPKDLAKNHDKYLYKEYERRLHR